MLGLEAWIPLYMTGQVTPLYIKGTHNAFFQHLLYTSGSYALSGECIRGFHNRGKYILTNRKDDMEYYSERASCILKKAHPLMDIYTAENIEQFRDFYQSLPDVPGNRHFITSSLPIFTLSEDLLEKVFRENQLPEAQRRLLREQKKLHGAAFEKILADNKLLHEVPLICEEEFCNHPLVLDFSEYGYGVPLKYSYADYQEHLKLCERFAEKNESYIFRPGNDFAFRNIQIRILEGKWVWITKTKSPMIHFVIHHPVLRDAIEKMYIPIRS